MSTAAPEPGDASVEPTETPDTSEPQVGPNGYPEKTKPEAMSAEHAAAYWRHEARKQQDYNKANAKRIKELEPKATQYEALEAASRTEAEQAADKARRDGEQAGREAALAEAREKYGSQAVTARLEAAAERKGLTAAQMLALAGAPARFLGDDGVDDDAIGDFLSALPDRAAAEPAAAVRPAVRDIGGGHRPGAKPNGVASGEDAFASRHGKKTSA